MMNPIKTALAGLTLLAMAACASPGVTTEQGNSPDGLITSYQVTAVPPTGMVQNALLVRNNATGGWELKMGSESRLLGEQLVMNILSPGVLPALISGAAGIQIAGEGCTSDCGGVIVYGNGTAQSVSSSVAGATAGAGATATANGS